MNEINKRAKNIPFHLRIIIIGLELNNEVPIHQMRKTEEKNVKSFLLPFGFYGDDECFAKGSVLWMDGAVCDRNYTTLTLIIITTDDKWFESKYRKILIARSMKKKWAPIFEQ